MSTVIRSEVSKKNVYYIPKHRYYELKHFCMQYPDWKRAIKELDGYSGKSSILIEKINTGTTSDQTEAYAQARLYFYDRIRMVENLVKEASDDLAELMLSAITNGVSYESLYPIPPCCKETWYKAYRKFFWLLDKARK